MCYRSHLLFVIRSVSCHFIKSQLLEIFIWQATKTNSYHEPKLTTKCMYKSPSPISSKLTPEMNQWNLPGNLPIFMWWHTGLTEPNVYHFIIIYKLHQQILVFLMDILFSFLFLSFQVLGIKKLKALNNF